MIFSEIYDLREYIVSAIGANCRFCDRDVDPSQYPIVLILMDNEAEVFYKNRKSTSIDLPLSLVIIVAEGQEHKALEVLDKIIQKINQFNSEKGHALEGTFTPEYEDDTKTFRITVLYNVKLIIQDT